MVYKRSYKKKAYSKKSTAWYNKKYSVGDMAATAYKGVKTLQGIINSEKHFVNYGASTAVTTTAGFTHLTAISQDDTISGRTGNSILSKSMSGKLQMTCNAGTASSVCRAIIFIDLQQVADTTPTIGTLLESDYLSLLSIASLGRYKVLYDKTVALDNVSNKIKVLPVNLRFDHHVRFNGTSSTDIQKGGLYLMLISSEASYPPNVVSNLRIGFYDN